MPAHPDFLAAFDGALRGGPLPAGLAARATDEVERRFAVYRNNVTVSLTEALAVRFPAIQRLVGAEFFAALARVFLQTDRPSSPILAEWGEGFADFLAGFPPTAALPYLPDVARIEYARGRAFHAADARPVDPARLAAADPDRLRLALHPSVILLRLSTPAVSIWLRNQPGGDTLPIPPGPETALILRDAAFAVLVRALGPGDTAMLQALREGETLGVAAARAATVDPGHDPQPILVDLMRAGAIIQPKD